LFPERPELELVVDFEPNRLLEPLGFDCWLKIEGAGVVDMLNLLGAGVVVGVVDSGLAFVVNSDCDWDCGLACGVVWLASRASISWSLIPGVVTAG
jgi:hypothetical protein